MNPIFMIGSALAGLLVLTQQKSSSKSLARGSQGRPLGAQLPQKSKAPASAQAARADQGNSANQPWYVGPAVAVGGQAVGALVSASKGLVSLFASNNDQIDTTTDADMMAMVQEDYGTLNVGDFGDNQVIDPGIDTSTMENTGFEYA
jgi:hypothetical protein